MMDFARTGEAVAKVLGMGRGAFLRAFSGSQIDANQDIVDTSSIGEPLRVFINDRNSWTGKSGELLSLLKNTQEEEITRRKDWPKDAARLSRELRRLSQSLRSEGVNVEFNTPARRLITITRIHQTTDITVTQGETGTVNAYERQLTDDSNHVDMSVDEGDTVTELSWNQARFDAIDGYVGEKRHSPGPCSKCGGRKFWERGDGVMLCGTCYPNPRPL